MSRTGELTPWNPKASTWKKLGTKAPDLAPSSAYTAKAVTDGSASSECGLGQGKGTKQTDALQGATGRSKRSLLTSYAQ
jgi:hypothetical protein